MSFITMISFIIGLALLIAGAELLVRGASRLAAALSISPLVIGLTVVAYGTSSPELAVSVRSSLTGQSDIALGNVVGSNIFNVLFILGLSALIRPLAVSRQLVRLDVPLMIGASMLLFILALDGNISRTDGLFLFACMVLYTVFVVRQGRSEDGADQEEYATESLSSRHESKKGLFLQAGYILAGLALLVLGSRWLVNGAVELARSLGISELIIGLTLVAAGTSLPEVATSVVAGLRSERDIAVGNVLGSNIFNIFGVLGLSSLFAPGGVKVAPAALNLDIPVMTAAALACLPIFFTGHGIARWEGALFFSYYIIYTLYLFLDAAGHDALPAFSAIMLEFVLPLSVVTLLVLLMRAHRHRTG
jgi:cation:H+ antiporter